MCVYGPLNCFRPRGNEEEEGEEENTDVINTSMEFGHLKREREREREGLARAIERRAMSSRTTATTTAVLRRALLEFHCVIDIW